MSIKVEKIVDPVVLGEGPHWDHERQALFFVSIPEHTVHKYVLATGHHTKTKLDSRASFIIPVEGTTNQFVVGSETKILVVEWDGEEGSQTRVVKTLGEVDGASRFTSINDGKVDPKGRLFAGSLGMSELHGNIDKENGSLYRLDKRGLVNLVDGITLANGLAWDVQRKAMYYIDSMESKIRRYDYDIETGHISNKKYVFDFKTECVKGMPDGMTIDTDGNLWVAAFQGSCVIKVDPTSGKLLQTVPVPALQVTSVTFGGPNYDILFVTTGSLDLGAVQEPPCGSTFMVTGLGVRGNPNLSFKL